jgi:hypothetical protein
MRHQNHSRVDYRVIGDEIDIKLQTKRKKHTSRRRYFGER